MSCSRRATQLGQAGARAHVALPGGEHRAWRAAADRVAWAKPITRADAAAMPPRRVSGIRQLESHRRRSASIGRQSDERSAAEGAGRIVRFRFASIAVVADCFSRPHRWQQSRRASRGIRSRGSLHRGMARLSASQQRAHVSATHRRLAEESRHGSQSRPPTARSSRLTARQTTRRSTTARRSHNCVCSRVFTRSAGSVQGGVSQA